MKNLANMKNPRIGPEDLFFIFLIIQIIQNRVICSCFTLQEAVHHIKLHVDIHLHMTGKAYQLGVCRPGQFKDV